VICNQTYTMVCRMNDISQIWEWVNRSSIVSETNCSDGYDNNCDGGGLVDCDDHLSCDGLVGPNCNICCDPGDIGSQISSDCDYNHTLPQDNSDCVIESCSAVSNQCVYTDRPACNQTECGPGGYCNQTGGFCMTPDQNRNVCENCFNHTPTDYGHWDNVTADGSANCCEYPIGGPFDDWCTNFDTFDGIGTYPLDLPGDSCVAGVWYDTHCVDGINNCDEDPLPQIDCGFGAGPPDYTSCGPCCDTCECINITTTTNYITSKTLVEQVVNLYFDNNDPTTDYKLVLYVPDPYLTNLRTCYGMFCGPWYFHFTNSTGNFSPNATITVPAGASNSNMANFSFIASGPTPVGKYNIEVGVRNPDDSVSCLSG